MVFTKGNIIKGISIKLILYIPYYVFISAPRIQTPIKMCTVHNCFFIIEIKKILETLQLLVFSILDDGTSTYCGFRVTL